MIISIIGAPFTGKSYLLESIMTYLGKPKWINFEEGFRCTKFNSILILEQYKNITSSGVDGQRLSSIPTGVFENFRVKNYRHIVFEGRKLVPKIKFLAENFDTTIFMLKINPEKEQIRQNERVKERTAKRSKGQHMQMKNLRMQDSLKTRIESKGNNNLLQKTLKQPLDS